MSNPEPTISMSTKKNESTPSNKSASTENNNDDSTSAITPTQVRPIDIVVAVYQYKTSNSGASSNIKLAFQPGETIYVLNKTGSGWWDGFIVDESNNGKVARGWFPQTYVRPLNDLFGHSKKSTSTSTNNSRRASYANGDNLSVSNSNTNGNNNNNNNNNGMLGLPSPSNKIRSKSRKNSLNFSFPNKTVPSVMNNSQSPQNNTVSDIGQVDPLQPSNNTNRTVFPPSRKQSRVGMRNSSSSSANKIPSEDVTVLSLEEVEMLINSLHRPTISTWSPVPLQSTTGTSDKLIYYNKELNIYCSELPMVSMTNTDSSIALKSSNMDSATSFGFPTDDHLINLSARRISTNPQSQTVNTQNDKSKTSSMTGSLTSSTTGGFRENSRKKSSLSADNDDSLSQPSKSNTDLKQAQNEPLYRQAILAKNDLFYHHSKDIKTWLELEDLTLHFTKMAHKMFLKIDRFNFFKFFNMMSNLAIFTQISCRLIQQEIKLKMCNRDVKRILKSLISSLSKININSMIYFDSSSRLQIHSTPVPSDSNALMASKAPLGKYSSAGNVNDESYLIDRSLDDKTKQKSVSTDTPITSNRNTSTSTTETLIPSKLNSNAKDLYDISQERISRAELRNISTSSNRDEYMSNGRVSYDSNINSGNDITNKGAGNNNIKTNIFRYADNVDHDSSVSLRIIFENIDQEFLRFMKNIHLLHHLLQNSVLTNESHILPQFLPRFFKGSFNGGSWTNPFASFIYPSESSGSSIVNSPLGGSSAVSSSLSMFNKEATGSVPSTITPKTGFPSNDVARFDNESQKPSISGSLPVGTPKMPPKMATAIALASGLPISETKLNSGHTSTSNSMTDITSSLTLSASKKLSNAGKNLSKAKISKRKIKYPLNTETYTAMKKISTSINDKLSLNFKSDAENFINQPKTKSRNLEINSRTYEQLNENTQLIDMLENLDLTIFINLKRLIKCPPKVLDVESEEFLRHAMSSISTIITEFYDVKQAFHDVLIRLIIATQQTTLDDPYIFSSMKSNFKIDFNEPKLLERITLNKNMKKIEKQSMRLYKHLVEQDVEFNNIEFLNTSEEFVDACEAYIDCMEAACLIVEQLIEERENLLNYAARMMKNNLTTELLKGEQEKWFEYTSEFNSDDEDEDDFYTRGKSDNDESMMDTSSDDADAYAGRKNRNIISSMGGLESQDVPWFLQSDYTHYLVYDSKGKVRGGTKEALIEHLTSHELIDPSFNVALLITFRSIFTTKEFFYALIYRYNLYPPEGLGFDEYNIWIEKKLNPIKCRVINIMKIFLQQYWSPHYYEDGLSSVENFVNYAISENIPGSDDLLQKVHEALVNLNKIEDSSDKQSRSNINQILTTPKGSNINVGNKLSLSQSRTALFRMKKLKLLDVDPYSYATQLTILEHDLYSRITLFECLDRVWGNKYCDMGGSRNITKFITNANTLTNFVSSTIVKHSDVKKRCKYIQFFIHVAQHCKELNNFSSMTAIVSALYSSPIYRLKKTWEVILVEDREILKKLNSLMDSKKNFIKYRGLLRSVKDVACVPFFGVYLSDLTFTNVGNADFIHGSKDIINFSKRNKIVDIIEEILSYKKVHYKLKRMDDIQTMIETSIESVPHIEEQYRLSLQMEPRSSSNSSNSHNHNKNPLDVDTAIK
ncbi:similar to Saccharomyces cerevisiae YLR310C CDC25 Membrane bound guanine nucleotide exchange factor (GEF or GDP-release factor) [Maudiozyma saulgeensis]|uniref:Similar to Saccharomyces cerevisiae YLR310C CDC25 Membrane bound guanine nucleotide exchange factor (GEF or GDP-release factor) n=1 Tax=Maudiozyma saulgeensis TaxID=1789683 RepID=A0A1X7R428_9SACH|nr:similar to Saccharomyces cerevisiae YLR310C CDC25 Membrane bound guanine nucleotide exchange factor (GEF or GDP-release factor) [Kazachstania saulgeensis]